MIDSIEIAAAVGIDPLTFWEITPRELSYYADAHKNRQDDRIALAYAQAHWTAQWFSKKPPESLEKILNKSKPKREMTDEEMFQRVKMLHMAFGGEM